jgi:hypothetical protein
MKWHQSFTLIHLKQDFKVCEFLEVGSIITKAKTLLASGEFGKAG